MYSTVEMVLSVQEAYPYPLSRSLIVYPHSLSKCRVFAKLNIDIDALSLTMVASLSILGIRLCMNHILSVRNVPALQEW